MIEIAAVARGRHGVSIAEYRIVPIVDRWQGAHNGLEDTGGR